MLLHQWNVDLSIVVARYYTRHVAFAPCANMLPCTDSAPDSGLNDGELIVPLAGPVPSFDPRADGGPLQ